MHPGLAEVLGQGPDQMTLPLKLRPSPSSFQSADNMCCSVIWSWLDATAGCGVIACDAWDPQRAEPPADDRAHMRFNLFPMSNLLHSLQMFVCALQGLGTSLR